MKTDLTADTARDLAAALKTRLDRALADYDRQFGGFRVEFSRVNDCKTPTLFVRVLAFATKDVMLNAAGIIARQVCAAHTYEGRPFVLQCVVGESRPRYF